MSIICSLYTQCVHTSHTFAARFPGSTVEAVKIGHDMTPTSQVIEKSLPVKAQDFRWIFGSVEGRIYGTFGGSVQLFSLCSLDHFWLRLAPVPMMFSSILVV